MNQYLTRYLNGEREEVWQDMVAMGHIDRESEIYKQVYKVAQETMNRVDQNINTIITRLEGKDYKFALPEYVKISPNAVTGSLIQQLELRVGPLPISLIAFYEIVGGVCLMGDHPGLATYASPLSTEPTLNYSDPLVVFPIEAAFEELGDFDQAIPDSDESYMNEFLIPIAPDDYHKENVSGGAPYEIAVPCRDADAILLNEWHQTSFINYLRISFRWGGFPGWERYPTKPEALLRSLTEGLLPI